MGRPTILVDGRMRKTTQMDICELLRIMGACRAFPYTVVGRWGPSGASFVAKPEKLNDQQCINAAAHRSLIDETVLLLRRSLDAKSQTMYLGRWELRAHFLPIGEISPRLDTSDRNRDQDVLSFLKWEHTVMGNWGGRAPLGLVIYALSTR